MKRDGSVWGIGSNNVGQIGGTGNRNAWTRIGADTGWRSIASGTIHGYALK